MTTTHDDNATTWRDLADDLTPSQRDSMEFVEREFAARPTARNATADLLDLARGHIEQNLVDIALAGVPLHPGTYTLWTLPTRGGVSLIISGQYGQWGTEYNQAQDLGRVKMKMGKPPAPIETYQMTLASEGGAKATLKLAWENTIATVPITVK